MAKFNVGDKAYIIESVRFIKEVEIIKITGGFYTIKFPKEKGGIRVRESRLYLTEQEAKKKIEESK